MMEVDELIICMEVSQYMTSNSKKCPGELSSTQRIKLYYILYLECKRISIES